MNKLANFRRASVEGALREASGNPLTERQRHYSPSVRPGAIKAPIVGDLHMDKVSASSVEPSNFSMRMGMHRFTRLTNCVSKSAEHHAHTVSRSSFTAVSARLP